MDPVTERTKKLTLKTHHSFPLQHKILDCKKWRIMLLQNLICIRILIWGGTEIKLLVRSPGICQQKVLQKSSNNQVV